MVVRLDRYLANLWYTSRRVSNLFMKDNNVLVNWLKASKSDMKLWLWDLVSINWDEFEVKENVYVLINKPKWYISSNIDENWYLSYRKLLDSCPYRNIVNVAWRLDWDTEWLLIATSDWKKIHEIISPKRNCYKKYYCCWKNNLSDDDLNRLHKWVKLDDWYLTKMSIVERLSSNEVYLSIVEWKYHQIKRMFKSIWNDIVYLKRLSIWNISLWNLSLWEWKYIDNLDDI